MPTFDVTIFLKNGASVKVAQDWDNGADLKKNLDAELGKEICSLSSDSKKDLLVIKNPKENVVGYYIDRPS
jgi:hypothetical protein